LRANRIPRHAAVSKPFFPPTPPTPRRGFLASAGTPGQSRDLGMFRKMWPARGKAVPVGKPPRPPPDTGAVLRGHAPVHAPSYDSARERCSGGTPPCTPPHMTAHASSYEMHTPARFSYELHRSESGVVREWCSRRPSAAPSVEPSTEPQARADAPAASYGMTVASPCRSPRTRRARSPRSAAAKAAGSRQRFAGCRVGEYMSSGVWRVPSFDRGNKAVERISDLLFPWSRA